jgi:hypothetical protein
MLGSKQAPGVPGAESSGDRCSLSQAPPRAVKAQIYSTARPPGIPRQKSGSCTSGEHVAYALLYPYSALKTLAGADPFLSSQTHSQALASEISWKPANRFLQLSQTVHTGPDKLSGSSAHGPSVHYLLNPLHGYPRSCYLPEERTMALLWRKVPRSTVGPCRVLLTLGFKLRGWQGPVDLCGPRGCVPWPRRPGPVLCTQLCPCLERYGPDPRRPGVRKIKVKTHGLKGRENEEEAHFLII